MATLTQFLIATMISVLNSFGSSDVVAETGTPESCIEYVDLQPHKKDFHYHLHSLQNIEKDKD